MANIKVHQIVTRTTAKYWTQMAGENKRCYCVLFYHQGLEECAGLVKQSRAGCARGWMTDWQVWRRAWERVASNDPHWLEERAGDERLKNRVWYTAGLRGRRIAGVQADEQPESEESERCATPTTHKHAHKQTERDRLSGTGGSGESRESEAQGINWRHDGKNDTTCYGWAILTYFVIK